jgi:TolB-like protein/class 3 adenylate cyclase/Tfp pilus assembly protein PilF
MPAIRRLAAILAADVAGYSRLMGADEEGTHERLKAHRRDLIDAKIREHSGRIVKTSGDGMLVEFASVVDALRCATEVQAGMSRRNARIPADRRIEFRIGLHQGDVVIDGDDIFGDAVNVAARLEALAEPGGICVSGRVRGDAGGKLDLAFEDMGQQELKNIARPLRVYGLRPEAIADPPAPGVPAAPRFSQPAAAPRLSIVVLPFANLGNDPEQQYFADGITEDLTTDLSRIPHMFVISRNTAFSFRNKPFDTKQICRDLGVRYVLEGSVRRSGNLVRVNAQLIDAATDAHIWAERFDCGTADLFSLQNDITSRLANTLGIELIAAEASRPPEHPDALDYVLRGRAVIQMSRSADSYKEAVNLFEHALALDAQSVEAQTYLAGLLANRLVTFMTASADTDLARAERLIEQALGAAPGISHAHYIRGTVLRMYHRWEEATLEFETAVSLDRNSAAALQGLGWCKLYTGSLEEAIRLGEQAIRLSPRDAGIGFRYHLIGSARLLQSRTDEAISWLEKARSAFPAMPTIRSRLASAYGLKGETERAAAELGEARKLAGEVFASIARLKVGLTGDVFSSIARMKASGPSGVQNMRAVLEATYFDGLRKAGLPEE